MQFTGNALALGAYLGAGPPGQPGPPLHGPWQLHDQQGAQNQGDANGHQLPPASLGRRCIREPVEGREGQSQLHKPQTDAGHRIPGEAGTEHGSIWRYARCGMRLIACGDSLTQNSPRSDANLTACARVRTCSLR